MWPLIRHLEDALAIADEIEDGQTGYLIERALDEASVTSEMQLLRARSSQEADRLPIVATVNFRAGAQQFGRVRQRASDGVVPPRMQTEARAVLCATCARS